MYKIGYEQTDKKLELEIYGLLFDLPKMDGEMQKNISEKIEKNKENIDIITKTIDILLGEGSVDKINKKRIEDGYKELDMMNSLQIITFIQSTIAKEMVKIKNDYKYNMNKTYRNNKPYRNKNDRF